MKKSSYLVNAVILTGAGLILRAAGMVFRVLVAGKIGAEGMGLYQLIFTVYQLFITMATAGLSVAATWLVTAEIAQNRLGRVRSALRSTLWLGVAVGTGAAVLQFALAGVASKWWLADSRAAICLRLLAPSLPFMAVASALRGYFLARRRAAPNAMAQIFEQAVRIGLVMVLLEGAVDKGIEACCVAVVLGNTVSEVLSCLYMVIATRLDLPKVEQGAKREPARGAIGRLREIMLPIAGGRVSAEALRTVENVMVPSCLTAALGNRTLAMEQYGGLKGMAMPVLFFPFSLLSTLATLLTPEITEAYLKKNWHQLQRLVGRVISITNLIAILLGGLFTMLAYPLGDVLYHSEEIGFYLRILAPLMPIMYLESMVDGVLKGMDEQLSTFRYSMWDSAIRIGCIVLLVPRLGMKGFLLVMVFSNLFTGLLNFRRLVIASRIRLRIWRWIVAPCLCIGASCWATGQYLSPLLGGYSPLVQMVGIAVGVTVLYSLLVLMLGLVPLADFLKKEPKTAVCP